MANGVAVRLELAPAPASDSEAIETSIGEAMADAAAAFSLGCLEWAGSGRITAPTKEAGASRIANLYWLSQSPGFDLATARAEAHRVLQERRGPDTTGTTDIIIDGIFEVLAKVTAFMRAAA